MIDVECNCSKSTMGCKQQYILDLMCILVEYIQIPMVKYIKVLIVCIEMKIIKSCQGFGYQSIVPSKQVLGNVNKFQTSYND